MYPDDFYYSKDHEWLKIEGEKGTVGITEFAQKQLGDVVYVELPQRGAQLEFHQSLGVIESVKAVSDIYSPLSGEIIEVNGELNESPELVNDDPHGRGWIVRIKIKDESEVEKLMSASEYEKFLEGLEE
ncbi:MAG: glycine cleavage system protein GcvH [Candidatus Aminicenantes bacterium]|jgi:glycine cleavage system H protein|nr:glycine cleavage system protein GcvH [Candidatus Aminicenantes bacterium]MDH5384600.1 glycine cleavage system protein GcvH [Candidatus Aminicenantes bacterium]MDH5743762.1 glycine cleavage system protein GcvH [Candidatus Aminicenantes bacterium]